LKVKRGTRTSGPETVPAGDVLRSRDAMHVACARAPGAGQRTLTIYDERMKDAATSIGFVVDAPV
jgi:hypothetical protein